MNERWADIPGYPEYKISESGVVKRVVGKSGATAGRILKPAISHNGYLSVTLYNNNVPSAIRINRLVLISFVGPCPEGHEGSHLDGDKTNNHIKNLVWETHKENMLRNIANGSSAKGERNGRAKLSEEQVVSIKREYKETKTSYTKLAAKYGVSFGLIGHIMVGREWSHV